jgi:ABC-type transporter Mla MlaB component
LVGPDALPAAPARALRPPAGPRTVVLVLGEQIHRGAVPGLCERVRALLASGDAELVTCDVSELVAPDASAVDALARLQLTARRSGGSIRLRRARGRLRDLLALLGLADALPLSAGLPVEPQRQVEHREQVGVDEEVDPRDPPV